MNDVQEIFTHLLGLDVGPAELSFGQMAARAVVVFMWILVLLNVADLRLVGKISGSDALSLVVLGSILSRAINGQAAFFPTLGVSGLLVLLHRGLMAVAYHSHWISLMAKRRDTVLVRNGKIDWAAMRRANITEDDLLENLRLNGNVGTIAEVKEARFERSGTISVLKN